MWLKLLLWLLALGNFSFGMAALFFPQKVAAWVHLELLNEAGRGELRAVYGGLVAALGVTIAWAMLRPAGREMLLAVGLVFAGLAAGRLLSLILDGPQGYTLTVGAIEAATAALLFYASRDLS